jgi:hypothetical protein
MTCKPEVERRLQVFCRTVDVGDGFEMDEPFTIEGVYEPDPSKWAKTLDTLKSFWRVWWTYQVCGYFSNLWSAICGRRDG